MFVLIDTVIVSLLAIGATVLLGLLGYLIEKTDESAEHKAVEGQRR
ncbi:MAG: hypothetical protein JO307_07175 [Bryobacterales bacterium]|nr:hypothetical protein [Bryobacterales bacterium]